jgi:hypothetical protein
MLKYFLEDDFSTDDQFDDEIDVVMGTTGDDASVNDEMVKEAVNDTEDGVDISCCVDDSEKYGDPEMVKGIDTIDITVDTSDVAPKADMLDTAADDLVDAVEDITFDDFALDDMIDAAKQLDVEDIVDADDEEESSEEDEDDFLGDSED